MKFMDLEEKYSGEGSYFYILPIEYEKDLTYGKGASLGPKEIIKASKHLEYYDEQFDKEPFEKGIHTLPSLKLNDKSPKEAFEMIKNEVKKHDKFIISIGGDHSVTIGAVKENCSVIVFDAHADMFSSWNGSEYNHRCVCQRLSEKHKVLNVGVRSMDVDEKHIIENNENIDIIKAHEFNLELFKEKLKNLDEKVYVSIDVDCFDPSFIRNTGTPEPGGFTWNQIIEMLEIISKSKNIIGADITEFSPKYNFEAEAFALAKLCYKIMALK